jgi:hypothetical protein
MVYLNKVDHVFEVKPAKDRVIISPVSMSQDEIHVVSKDQGWRGRIVRSDDAAFPKGMLVRFQPMKRRYDVFKWKDGETYLSVVKKWIYLLEGVAGNPLKVFGNRVVLKHIADRRVLEQHRLVGFLPAEVERAEVRLVSDSIGDELEPGNIVVLRKSDYWQHYRVDGDWLFVSDISNLKYVEQS